MRKDDIPRVTSGKFLNVRPEGSIALYGGVWLNFADLNHKLSKEEKRASRKFNNEARSGSYVRGASTQAQACAQALQVLTQKKPEDFATSPIWVDNWLASIKRGIVGNPEDEPFEGTIEPEPDED